MGWDLCLLGHTGKKGPRPWGGTRDFGVGTRGGTLKWDPRVGPWSGTLGWDHGMGPWGETIGWDPGVRLG